MKTSLKLAIIATIVSVQSVFANGEYTPIPDVPTPDGGATALLAALSVGGLVLARKFVNRR